MDDTATSDASPAGDRAGAAEPVVSALRDAIPSAPRLSLWVDQTRRQLRWEVANGPVLFDYPKVMTLAELAELEQVLTLCLKSANRVAQAIEARQGQDRNGLDAKHESAVACDAPKGDDRDQ